MLHLPYELYTAEQTRQLDALASEQHAIAAATLMARAGAAALTCIQHRWPEAKHILAVCGSGNNGGDGYELARQALDKNYHTTIIETGNTDKMSQQTFDARQALLATGAEIQTFNGALTNADIIVDCLFGTGLDREVTGLYAQLIESINNSKCTAVLSLDIPSGMDADSGQALGLAIKASATISFIGLNIGLFNADAADYTGQIFFDGLDVPQAIYQALTPIACRLYLDNEVMATLVPRQRNAHKGHFGHVLIIGGDHGMSGAPRIAAEASARVGAGLISVATRCAHSALFNLTRPELMCHGIDNIAELSPLTNAASVIAIGPGLGQSQWSQALLQKAIETELPLIVDADALNLLSQQPQKNDHWILTPHPGEAGRLLGCSSKQIQANRLQAVKQLYDRYGGVIVLKGAGTLIYNGEGSIRLASVGNPGMASGGMGDALVGIIAGLVAQQFSLMNAACVGVILHGMAADKAAEQDGERGMLAMDLMPHLRHLANLRY